jgi:hypothetical protein
MYPERQARRVSVTALAVGEKQGVWDLVCARQALETRVCTDAESALCTKSEKRCGKREMREGERCERGPLAMRSATRNFWPSFSSSAMTQSVMVGMHLANKLRREAME